LLCISTAIFEKLALEIQESPVIEPIPAPVSTPVQRTNTEPDIKRQLALPMTRYPEYLEYTRSSIWQTRYSEFWQWRRVKQWWREFKQDHFINEKRHILL
jgi:hypothetical protein